LLLLLLLLLLLSCCGLRRRTENPRYVRSITKNLRRVAN
jgi:hypothetical protein